MGAIMHLCISLPSLFSTALAKAPVKKEGAYDADRSFLRMSQIAGSVFRYLSLSSRGCNTRRLPLATILAKSYPLEFPFQNPLLQSLLASFIPLTQVFKTSTGGFFELIVDALESCILKVPDLEGICCMNSPVSVPTWKVVISQNKDANKNTRKVPMSQLFFLESW